MENALPFLLIFVLVPDYTPRVSCARIPSRPPRALQTTVLAAVDASFSAVPLALEDTTLFLRKQLREFAQRFHVFLVRVQVIAIPIPPTLIEKLLEGIKTTSFLHKPGDVDLRTDEITHSAFVIVQRCGHDKVHERRPVSAVVEYCLEALPARPYRLFYPSNRVAICFGSLQEATIPADDVVSSVLGCAVEFFAGVDNGVVADARIREAEDLVSKRKLISHASPSLRLWPSEGDGLPLQALQQGPA